MDFDNDDYIVNLKTLKAGMLDELIMLDEAGEEDEDVLAKLTTIELVIRAITTYGYNPE